MPRERKMTADTNIKSPPSAHAGRTSPPKNAAQNAKPAIALRANIQTKRVALSRRGSVVRNTHHKNNSIPQSMKMGTRYGTSSAP